MSLSKMVRSSSCSPPGDSPFWQNTSEAILNFGIRAFYTFSLLISIKIKALCFHTRSVLGPRASSVWDCEPCVYVCVCVCVCVWLCADYYRVFNGPDKAGGGNIFSQCLKNSAINTELLIMRWRILKSDHFSTERNLQGRSELLRGVMKIICLLEIKRCALTFVDLDCFHSTCSLTTFCVKISLLGCSHWKQLDWWVTLFNSDVLFSCSYRLLNWKAVFAAPSTSWEGSENFIIFPDHNLFLAVPPVLLSLLPSIESQ